MKNNSTMSDVTPKYRILKCQTNTYIVDFKGQSIICSARKKIKASSDIMVGDFVTLENIGGDYIVDKVMERKNFLTRPYISNLDQIIIVAASIPTIDYALVDKLIINSHKQNLDIVLCINKADLQNRELMVDIISQYAASVGNIISVSAVTGELDQLKFLLKNKLSCFAGQSAVGKSSIINCLLEQNRQTVGAVSQKNLKGKNTTTGAEIIKLEEGAFIIDTPGFSMLDIHEINYNELDLYYNEYNSLSSKCKYHRCTHSVEPQCAVRDAVEAGNLSKSRYERYLTLAADLKKIQDKQFK